MTSSSSFESSKLTPCENTPLGGVSFGGPVSQDKKKSSRSFFQVVVPLFLVCLGFTVYSRLSSLGSSSSGVDQSISKSVNKVNENDSNVFPTVSLVESETQTNLDLVAKGTTTTELSEERTTTYYLQFPQDIYEESMNTDTKRLRTITNRCNTYLDEHKEKSGQTSYTAAILACHIYTGSITPIVFGTLTTGVDVFELATDWNNKINSKDVSVLFVDYAFAAMIDRQCFVWDNQNSQIKGKRTQFNGKSEYNTRFSDKTGLDVSGSVTYAGITAEAGYKKSNNKSGGSEGTTEIAYGQELYSADVGELRNDCFSSQEKFNSIKDLVKPEWKTCWETIRAHGRTIDDLLQLKDTDCFRNVAKGGFEMPLKYMYSVGTKSTLSTSYTTHSKEDKSGASKAITAGLDASYGGAKVSAKTAITDAVDQSKKDSKFEGTVTHETVGFGYNVGITCIEKGDCAQVIAKSVEAIREDYTLLGKPSSLGPEYKTLDDILKLYFGDYGLPDKFLSAYNEYNKPETFPIREVERTTVTVKMDNTDKYTSYTIHSRNHQFSLEFQDDGNLVLYDLSRYRLPMGGVLHDKYISRRSVWSTDTIHKEYIVYHPTRLAFQGDGNLVLYAEKAGTQWASGTTMSDGLFFLTDNGNMGIIEKSIFDNLKPEVYFELYICDYQSKGDTAKFKKVNKTPCQIFSLGCP